MCDRVGVLYAGRLVEEGPVDEVFDDPRHPYTVGLLRCIPRGGVRKDQRRLDTIPGFLPAARRGPARRACSSTAAALAQDICSQEEPPFHDLGDGRHSRCHFWEQAHELPRADARRAAFKAESTGAPSRVDPRRRACARRSTRTATTSARWRTSRFALRPGETLGLVGESGSGKTTLARARCSG